MRVAILAAFVLALRSAALGQDEEGRAPKQPIPFNHKLHVTTLNTRCEACHASHDPGEMVDMPDTGQCLQCHASIEAKSPGEKKLAAFAKQNRSIDWVRVYQIPTFVRFDHRQHAQAGVRCEACHGDVAERASLWREKDVSMGSCMACHREMHASIDCGTCHEPR